MAVTEDGETGETSTPKTSYKDYLELWEFLLEKGKFKVWEFTSFPFKKFLCSNGTSDYLFLF